MNWLVSWWPRGNDELKVRASLVSSKASANKLDQSPLQELCFVHAVCTSSNKDVKEIQQKTIQLREEWRQVIHAWATQAFDPKKVPKNEPELVTWTRALNEMCHDPSQTEKGDALQMLKPECRGVLTSPALNALLLACIWERHMFLLNQQPLRDECFWFRDPMTQLAQLRATKGGKEYRGVFGQSHRKSYEIWLDVYFVYLDYIIARIQGLSQEQKQILIERRIELFQRIHDREINASHHQAVANDTPSTDPDGAGVSAGTAEALHEDAAETEAVF